MKCYIHPFLSLSSQSLVLSCVFASRVHFCFFPNLFVCVVICVSHPIYPSGSWMLPRLLCIFRIFFCFFFNVFVYVQCPFHLSLLNMILTVMQLIGLPLEMMGNSFLLLTLPLPRPIDAAMPVQPFTSMEKLIFDFLKMLPLSPPFDRRSKLVFLFGFWWKVGARKVSFQLLTVEAEIGILSVKLPSVFRGFLLAVALTLIVPSV